MKAEVYWVDGPWPGRLGIVPRPRGGDWLSDEVRAWREAGIQAVASLLTPDEASELDLQPEAACVRAEGLDYLRLPIPDYGTPPSVEDFSNVVQQLDRMLEAGRSVAVHCRQGIGRSSVLVASQFVSSGMEPEEAFRRIEQARGRPVPDTREQRDWVTRHAPALGAKLVRA